MKNKSLKIIITILTILVIVLSGYILYDKVLNRDEVQEPNTNQDTINGLTDDNQESEHVELEETLKKELIEIFEVAYNYYDSGNAYCGDTNNNDRIESNFENAMYYTASNKYNSYEAMIKELKKYMTEHVIYGKGYMGSDNGSYIEKDGKLYCANFGKGDNMYQLTTTTITYSKPYTDVIYTKIETELSYDEYKIYEYYDVTFSKRDNNWIISSYERKEQYTFSDFSGTVFQNNDGSGNNYLILWDNGTYSYEGTLGNYIVEGKTIRLNYIFENGKKVTSKKSIELTINSVNELVDNKNKVTLGRVNQPTSPGDWNFYDEINN